MPLNGIRHRLAVEAAELRRRVVQSRVVQELFRPGLRGRTQHHQRITMRLRRPPGHPLQHRRPLLVLRLQRVVDNLIPVDVTPVRELLLDRIELHRDHVPDLQRLRNPSGVALRQQLLAAQVVHTLHQNRAGIRHIRHDIRLELQQQFAELGDRLQFFGVLRFQPAAQPQQPHRHLLLQIRVVQRVGERLDVHGLRIRHPDVHLPAGVSPHNLTLLINPGRVPLHILVTPADVGELIRRHIRGGDLDRIVPVVVRVQHVQHGLVETHRAVHVGGRHRQRHLRDEHRERALPGQRVAHHLDLDDLQHRLEQIIRHLHRFAVRIGRNELHVENLLQQLVELLVRGDLRHRVIERNRQIVQILLVQHPRRVPGADQNVRGLLGRLQIRDHQPGLVDVLLRLVDLLLIVGSLRLRQLLRVRLEVLSGTGTLNLQPLHIDQQVLHRRFHRHHHSVRSELGVIDPTVSRHLLR